jgi:hypothetical protein
MGDRSAQVPFSMTQARKDRLRATGHDDAAISKMTPDGRESVDGGFGAR